jgi:hypothetical protein
MSDTTASLGRKIPQCGRSSIRRPHYESPGGVEHRALREISARVGRYYRNIDELLEDLNGSFYRLRQSGIDAELFDVISGFEALARPRRHSQMKA